MKQESKEARMAKTEFVITTNSPGEVAGWLTPVARELKKAYPESKITVFVPPCTFASGQEVPVIRKLPEVDAVYGPTGFIRYLLGGRLDGFNPGGRGLVIFLGGDLTHAVLLSKRTGYPAVAYTDRTYNWGKTYREFYVPSGRVSQKIIRKGAPPGKVTVVGDLMLAAFAEEKSADLTREVLKLGQRKVLTFFPGSRPNHFAFLLPFYWETAGRLLAAGQIKPGEYAFTVAVAPFISLEDIQEVLVEDMPEVELVPAGDMADERPEGHQGEVEQGRGRDAREGNRLEVLGSLRRKKTGQPGPPNQREPELLLVRNGTRQLLGITDLAVTIPGTNNVELATFGVPALVLLPLNKVEEIPLPGLAGLLGNLPLVGRKVKELVVNRLLGKMDLLSPVNRQLDEEVFPELVGEIGPEDVAGALTELLPGSERALRIRRRLAEGFIRRDAAARLVAQLQKHLPPVHC